MNHTSRCRVTGAKRANRLQGTILLALSLSVMILIIIQGTTTLAGTGVGQSQVTVTAATSISYARQWGSYGGPITPNGGAGDSSGNLFIADPQNYPVYKLAGDGPFFTPCGSQR